MKKFISIFLAVLMLVTMLPLSVFAENKIISKDNGNTDSFSNSYLLNATSDTDQLVCNNVRIYEYNGYIYVINNLCLYRYSLDFSEKELLLSDIGYNSNFSIYKNVIYIYGSYGGSLIAYDIDTDTSKILTETDYGTLAFYYGDNIYFEKYNKPSYQIIEYNLITNREKVIFDSSSYDLTLQDAKNNILIFSDKDSDNECINIYMYNADTSYLKSTKLTMHSRFDSFSWSSFYIQDILITDDNIYMTAGSIEGSGLFYTGDVYVSDFNSFSFKRIAGSYDKTGCELFYFKNNVYVTADYDRYGRDYGLLCIDDWTTNLCNKSIIANYGGLFLYLEKESLYLFDIETNNEKLVIDGNKYKELFKEYKEKEQKENPYLKDDYFSIYYQDLSFDGQNIAYCPSLVIPSGVYTNTGSTIHTGDMEFVSLKQETFSKNKYIADIWLNRHDAFDETVENGYINSLLSITGHISGDLAENLTDDKGFVNAVVGWKSMEVIFNPIDSTAELVYLDQNKIYQALVFDLLKQCLSNEEYKELVSSKISQVAGDLNGAFGTGSEILNELNIHDFENFKKLALGDTIEIDQKYFKILYDNFKGSEKIFKNIDNFCFIAKGIIKGASTITDFINQLSMYYTAMELSLSQSAVLYEMAKNTSAEPLKDALITIADIAKSDDFSSGLLKAICEATDKTALYLTSYIADETMKLIPIYGTLKMVYDVASSAVDILLNTNGIIDAYYLLLCTSEICDASKLSIVNLAQKYVADTTEINAGAFIESVKMYLKIINIDLQSACEFVKASNEDGLFNLAKKVDKKILSIFGFTSENTYEEVCQSKDNIIISVELMYDWLETSWVLDECYLKSDYPDVYPIYAKQEIIKKTYTPVATNVRINKDGKTELQFGYIPWVDGIEIKENISGNLKYYSSNWTDIITCYNESKKDVFPKTYAAVSYFNSEQGKVYSNISDEYSVKLPLMTPCVTIPTFRDLMTTHYGNRNTGITIAITDNTNTYYDNIKYHIYRKADDSDYEEIAVIDRSNLYNGKTTLFADKNIVSGKSYSYAVQSEIIFSNGVSAISPMSDSLTFGDSIFENRITNIDINDMRIPQNPQSPFARLSYRETTNNDSDEGVKITWENNGNAAGYEIYRKPSYGQIYKKITTVTDCVYIDKDISAGQSFDYFVIEYTGTENNKIYADCSDVVSIEYKSIDIQNNKSELYTGEAVLLNATTHPSDENIQWSVDDNSVATIDRNGLLTAKSAGTVIVTATLDNGLSDKIEITVIEKNISQEVQTGDVNGDGKLTASDARAALRMSAKLDTPTQTQFAAADVNGDGKLTASDARIILRVSAKLQTF